MFKRAFLATIFVTLIAVTTVAASLALGTHLPQKPMVIAIMKQREANLPPFDPQVMAPFLRVIDVEHRLSVTMRPSLAGVVDMQYEFGQEPSFRVFASDMQVQDGGSVATTYGFYRYRPLSGVVEPVFERHVDQHVSIRSAQDFSVDMSFGPGQLLFTDPATGQRHVLDIQTGALQDFVDLQNIGASRDVIWWSPDHSRFAYVKDGHLAVASAQGSVLSEFANIPIDDYQAATWTDGGQSLLITSFSDATLPNTYINASTGAVIDPFVAQIEGYRLRFRQDCGPNVLTYEQVNQELYVVDLDTHEEWLLIPPEANGHFISQIHLLSGCDYAIVTADNNGTGQYRPGLIFLSDGHGEHGKLLHENTFLFQAPDRNGDYMFGERLANNRLRIYDANLFDSAAPELWREVPDLAQMQSAQLLDDSILFSAGEGFGDRRLAMIDDNGKRTIFLTPADENLVFFRYYGVQD